MEIILVLQKLKSKFSKHWTVKNILNWMVKSCFKFKSTWKRGLNLQSDWTKISNAYKKRLKILKNRQWISIQHYNKKYNICKKEFIGILKLYLMLINKRLYKNFFRTKSWNQSNYYIEQVKTISNLQFFIKYVIKFQIP